MKRAAVVAAAALGLTGLLAPAAHSTLPSPVVPVARKAEPVVLTGAQLPTWSRLAAQGSALPWPSGYLDGVRDAHHGTLVVPPDVRTGVDPDQVVAYKWDAASSTWAEVPVQVDERFPYFLANANSDFAMYSAVDEELTYAWDVERWKMTAGSCTTAFPTGVSTMADPVPTLDDDDEIAFMASDAGAKAPAATRPTGTTGTRQEIALADPLDPAKKRFVYLFLKSSGPSAAGYVTYTRDGNADEYIDKGSFVPADPEKLGSSNEGYGPNLGGDVCDGTTTARTSTDRFPRDGVTVTTDNYTWHASGRWMVRSMQVAKPTGGYGPDLIDRWKGRAFQQSPDSSISVVGFEDEQVNWEGNSSLLGERTGPVRAIREVWGADSGTNVTKTETFYRDAVTYRYHLRVHPIPPDGLYTSWDYNANVATKYYNALKPNGVDIDGVNDDVGNVDSIGGQPAFFDAPDPTFNTPLSVFNWEQVSGTGDAGSLVYLIELKGATSAGNPAVVPYYRDDKCLDDGTGDNPVPRPWPGEASTDTRVMNGYVSYAPTGSTYATLTCDQKQGAWGSHGVHFFATHDTDNAFTPKTATEVDAQQWQFAVPTAAPANVGDPYANVVKAKLVPVAVEQPAGP